MERDRRISGVNKYYVSKAEQTTKLTVLNVLIVVLTGGGGSSRQPGLQSGADAAEYDIKNIQWTTCKDFTVQRGQEQIEEYISTWEFHESWLHWTQFLREEDMKYSKRYHYRVCWSTPTRRKPIPRATASVYFIIEVSKIKPATLPVEVFFILETSRLIHRPGECRFREKWLKDIIENKIILMESLIL
ncbi:PREDICTED: A-kinase anchor protein 14 [Tinamus guttatus]|nr:PREDICTED: A-kinase anchor protein 14 [Tinamus guttatus]